MRRRARQIVGKGGAHIRARLDDLRLAEGRMDRIDGAQQFEHGARGEPAALFVLDHRRADHEAAIAARHDIDGMARMQHAARAAATTMLVRRQHQHLAFDAAQIGELFRARRSLGNPPSNRRAR